MKKSIILLSGGLDSATVLAQRVEEVGAQNIIALTMYYGQKHDKEIQCAKKLCEYYHIKKHIIKNLSDVFSDSDCTLLQGSLEDISETSYEEQTKGNKIPTTYVPFRNGLLLSYATVVALDNNADSIYIAAHKDDACGAAYPDCTVEFINYISKAIYAGSGEQVQVKDPFINSSKSDIVATGLKLKVPYEYTWSCYKGNEKPCAKCGTCIDRARAFEVNNVTDPLYTVRVD